MKNNNLKVIKHNLKIIKQVEKIRAKNNVNWMNILRLAFKKSPKSAAKIMSKIYIDDDKITQLVRKLSN